jgi:hypothetical protein
MPTSVALIGIALLGNLVSGFSCGAAMPPLPTTSLSEASCRLRNILMPTHNRSNSLSSYSKSWFHGGGDNPLLLHSSSTANNHALTIRGGALSASSTAGDANNKSSQPAVVKDLNLTIGNILASLWGSCGVVYILVKAIKRVLPIAVEPFTKKGGAVPLTQFQLA